MKVIFVGVKYSATTQMYKNEFVILVDTKLHLTLAHGSCEYNFVFTQERLTLSG